MVGLIMYINTKTNKLPLNSEALWHNNILDNLTWCCTFIRFLDSYLNLPLPIIAYQQFSNIDISHTYGHQMNWYGLVLQKFNPWSCMPTPNLVGGVIESILLARNIIRAKEKHVFLTIIVCNWNHQYNYIRRKKEKLKSWMVELDVKLN